ncbi:MAG: hypothetical protein IPH13_10780 [Planctomycetes bacterium]|nr:hypothetical protein [Planctomycetota bacterium]MCC7172526.1 hypothetical protein [Planctomycetota bacterium]
MAKPEPKKEQEDDAPFLGTEFLTWLWWSAEVRGGVHAVGDDQRVGVVLDRVLEFKDDVTGVKVAVRGDAPTRAPEAREALARGMTLERAGVVIAVDDENTTIVLDGATLDLRGVKSEVQPEGDSAEDRDANALALLFGMLEALDKVYRAFVLERTSPAFVRDVAPKIVDWAKSARKSRATSRPKASETA